MIILNCSNNRVNMRNVKGNMGKEE